jgi:opacity protein-like surface antigen
MNMKGKILLLCVVLVGLCGSTALALDPMGPPKANLQKDQWSVGIDYSWGEMTIQRTTANWSDAKNTADLDDMQKIYATIGYGLSENVEGFVRIGIGSTDVERKVDWTKWESDGGDWDAIWGLGVKATLSEDENVTWGILAQYSSAELSCDQKESGGETPRVDLDITELQIAFGPTWDLGDGVSVYGGPFLHIIDGSYVDNKDNGDVLTKSIEEESQLGGYVGVSIDLAANSTLCVEYQNTGEAEAIAGLLSFRF